MIAHSAGWNICMLWKSNRTRTQHDTWQSGIANVRYFRVRPELMTLGTKEVLLTGLNQLRYGKINVAQTCNWICKRHYSFPSTAPKRDHEIVSEVDVGVATWLNTKLIPPYSVFWYLWSPVPYRRLCDLVDRGLGKNDFLSRNCGTRLILQNYPTPYSEMIAH